MNKKEEFTAEELELAIKEKQEREAKAAARKKKWRDDKFAENPEEQRAKRAAQMREWRKNNPERAKEISKKGNNKYKKDNPATRRKSAREYNSRVRSKIYDFFGNKCVKCSFSDSRALQLDHINGGGNQARKAGKHGLHDKFKMIKDDPDLARATFQLLCANCNFIKRDEEYEYGKKIRLAKKLIEMEEEEFNKKNDKKE